MTAVQEMGAGREKPLPGVLLEWMTEANVASIHSLHEHPGVLWKPLGRDGVWGMEKGLPAMENARDGSFL